MRIRRGEDPDLIIRLPSGLHAAIAMSWTNYATDIAPELLPDSSYRLDFIGLRRAVQLISLIRQQKRELKLDGENPPQAPEGQL